MKVLKRFLIFLGWLLVFTALLFGTWALSAALLPRGALRPVFSWLFSARVGEFTFMRVLIANLFPFLGIQFMNLFRAGKYPGGLPIEGGNLRVRIGFIGPPDWSF